MFKVFDFVIGIKNAANANRREISFPYSKLNKEVGRVLVKEGFLEEIKEEAVEDKKFLRAKLKYDRRVPRFIDAKIISKPSLKKYFSAKQIPMLEKRGRRIMIVSTSEGVMAGRDAVKKNLGGEVLFAIW